MRCRLRTAYRSDVYVTKFTVDGKERMLSTTDRNEFRATADELEASDYVVKVISATVVKGQPYTVAL